VDAILAKVVAELDAKDIRYKVMSFRGPLKSERFEAS
jgi:hypothetical protein